MYVLYKNYFDERGYNNTNCLLISTFSTDMVPTLLMHSFDVLH